MLEKELAAEGGSKSYLINDTFTAADISVAFGITFFKNMQARSRLSVSPQRSRCWLHAVSAMRSSSCRRACMPALTAASHVAGCHGNACRIGTQGEMIRCVVCLCSCSTLSGIPMWSCTLMACPSAPPSRRPSSPGAPERRFGLDKQGAAGVPTCMQCRGRQSHQCKPSGACTRWKGTGRECCSLSCNDRGTECPFIACHGAPREWPPASEAKCAPILRHNIFPCWPAEAHREPATTRRTIEDGRRHASHL